MANTSRRWSGLVEVVDGNGRSMGGLRAHISKPDGSAVEDGGWHGSFLARGNDDVELLSQFVGPCTMTLGNDRQCQIIVGDDGTFVGLDSCPVELW